MTTQGNVNICICLGNSFLVRSAGTTTPDFKPEVAFWSMQKNTFEIKLFLRKSETGEQLLLLHKVKFIGNNTRCLVITLQIVELRIDG